jgi:MYXO-CTERM domain-containing protein
MMTFRSWLAGGLAALVLAVAVPAGAGMPLSDIEDQLVGTIQSPNQIMTLACGDFDDDGIDDLAGAITVTNSENGIGVIRGQPGGFGQIVLNDQIPAARFGSTQLYDRMGTSMAVGDIDGDGVDDLLVGAPGGAAIQGEVILLFGEDFPGAWQAEVEGGMYVGLHTEQIASRFGWRVASGADLTGNGYDDIAVCAPQTNDDLNHEIGALYLYEGRNDWNVQQGDAFDPMRTLLGEGALCSAVLMAADPLGDADPVLLVGDSAAAEGKGRVYVVRAGNMMTASALINEEAVAVITADVGAEGFGESLAAVTGLEVGGPTPDLVVGLPSHGGGYGAVYLFDLLELGGGNLGSEQAQVKIFGSWEDGQLGSAVVAGKGFGGGQGTVWMGAPGALVMGPQSGAVLILDNNTIQALPPEIWAEEMPGIVLGDHADGHAGAVLAWGQLDSDSDADVVIAEPDYQHGSMYVLRSATLDDSDGDGWVWPLADCDDGNEHVHPFAPEECDGLDNDCNGDVPPEELDEDGDGFSPCEGDCEPQDPGIHPAAAEDCGDGTDNDCDGDVDEQDDECGDPGDDDAADDDDDDDTGYDDDNPTGFRCECRQAPAGTAWPAVIPLAALGAALLLRRR